MQKWQKITVEEAEGKYNKNWEQKLEHETQKGSNGGNKI